MHSDRRFAIYTLLLGAALVRAVPADAAEKARSPAPDIESPAGAAAPAIVMSAEDCRRLLARLAGAGVALQPVPGVNYQPGQDIDSQGRPIAPADLSGSNPLPLDHMLALDLKIPLSTLLGDRAPSSVKESDLHVAAVTVDPMSGRLAFDGRALDRAPETEVAAACREQLRKARP